MKVLLIDDHPLILAALRSVIQGLGDHVEVASASSGAEARAMLQADSSFELVLLDLHLGDADGFDLLTEFRGAYPGLPVVVVSASDRTSDVIRAIDLGAMGFVPKRASNETLVDALRQVISGGVYVPPMSMGTSLAGAPAGSVQHEAIGSNFQTASLAQLGLTQRQTQVLALLLQGQPNKLIARELDLSVETIKDHVASVLRILRVSSRTQAVIAVSQMLQAQDQRAVDRFSAWRASGRR
ncbi:DNA-binding response regulator [Aquabacterium soli]|jgi:DNA-binding NarL/FixJ family response regulator|uniref:DNA-binding response regulator n=1 Tax=Aquabacterium soli TaxID=2493092 RepID=A0A426V861_9BURK|nr:response regulator transcription factor [Aquabacterium soli]RRS03127.1 DNA-binding response regulator [Aquabacterium soli]